MRFFSHKKIVTKGSEPTTLDRSAGTESRDVNKRRFLKLLGLVGVGVGAATLFPHEASAATEGAPRLTDVVKLENSSDVQVDIETQGTIDSIKTATEGTQTAATSIKTNTDTLVTNSAKFTFTGSNLNVQRTDLPNALGLVNSQATRVSPFSEDSVVMLRRIVKLMESQAAVDSNTRQRVTIDAFNTETGAVADSGTLNVDDVQTSSTLTDSTKASTWLDNSWSNYALAITSGTGSGQVRMIASSTITTITIVGSWGVTPDSTSTYEIRNLPSKVIDYGIWNGPVPFVDVIYDMSKNWSSLGGYWVRIRQSNVPEQIRVIFGTSSNSFNLTQSWTPYIDPTTVLDSGSVSVVLAPNLLVDWTKRWNNDQYYGKQVKITGGTGIGQVRYINTHPSNMLFINPVWTTIPDTTSTYAIYPTFVPPQYQICEVPILFTDIGTASGVARVVSATDSTVGTVTNITSANTIGSYPYQQMHGDKAHEVYQDAIRSQLTFS